jgi:hypothetical protein
MKLPSFLTAATPGRPVIVVSGKSERFDYSAAVLRIELLLSPEKQDELETRHAAILQAKQDAISDATAAYDDALATLKAERNRSIDVAHTAYEVSKRALLVEYAMPSAADAAQPVDAETSARVFEHVTRKPKKKAREIIDEPKPELDLAPTDAVPA